MIFGEVALCGDEVLFVVECGVIAVVTVCDEEVFSSEGG